MKISFFIDDSSGKLDETALKSGVYEISLAVGGGELQSLYIGQSYCMAIRCSEHLFFIKTHPDHYGFPNKAKNSDNIHLEFKVLYSSDDYNLNTLKEKEKYYIEQNQPLRQYKEGKKSDQVLKDAPDRVRKFIEESSLC